MSALEQIVRPFQRTGVSYPVRIFDPTQKAAEDAVLALGKEGSTKTFNESLSQRVTTYQDQEIKEKSRETEVKRVTNPDDDSQYVDVENIKKLVTEQGEGTKYQKSTYSFTNT
jgi:antirestriction protein